jgi:hypothetical protein
MRTRGAGAAFWMNRWIQAEDTGSFRPNEACGIPVEDRDRELKLRQMARINGTPDPHGLTVDPDPRDS